MSQLLADSLGEAVLGQHEAKGELWLRVDQSAWGTAAGAAKAAGFTYFSFLSAIDWQPNPDLDGEHVYDSTKSDQGSQAIIEDATIRLGGGTSRFQVFGRLHDVVAKSGVILFTDLDGSLTVRSWTDHFSGADWHERETWEMFGITFEGHSGLRHIYLPDQFEGHPLRKDYPLLAREVRPWPGLVDMEEMPEVAGNAEADS